MTRRRVGIVLLLGLAGALGYLLWLQTSVRMGGTPAALHGSARTEEEWIVRTIVSDLAQMALSASGARGAGLTGVAVTVDAEPGPETGGWRVTVRLPGRDRPVERTLSLLPHPWTPGAYVELVRGLLPRPPTSTELELPDREMVVRLLAADTTSLVDEDFRISDRLSVAPASPSAHEEAALLLASLALHESAGDFSDPRHELDRMTAHLAMAEALSGSTEGDTEVGPLTRAALVVLTGRERDALAAVASLRNDAWRRALQMRVTDDWRLLRNPEKATPFEKREWFRAMSRTLRTATAMERYEAAFPDEVDHDLDWYHIAIESFEGPSDGYYFDESLLKREIDDLRTVGRRYGESILAVDLSLNEPPLGLFGPEGDGPRVAGWSTWAGIYQRHLCDHLVKADTYYRIALGMAESAEAFRAFADPELGRMILHPFVRMRRTNRRGVQVESIDAMADVVETTVRAPERVNAENWFFGAFTTNQMAMRRGFPRASEWLSPRLAIETAFDVRGRFMALERNGAADDVSAIRRLAPSNVDALRFFLALPGSETIPVAALTSMLGARAEYDLRALYQAQIHARRSRLDEAPFAERMCEIDSSTCAHLGELLIARDDEPGAFRAFRKAFDEATDRVEVSNHMEWLVRYYHEHHDDREALAVARDAADTGSSFGLTTLAKLLEELDRVEEAEELFQRNRERYDHVGPLIAFYFRLGRVQGLPRYQQKLADTAEELFPGGLTDYFEADNDTPPRDGVLINSDSDLLRRSGLNPGDIVVALDGFRVRNWAQYETVREFTSSPDIRLVVWRVNRYVPVEATVRDRRFQVEMINYRPRVSIDSLVNR
jgi:hypothetical protein